MGASAVYRSAPPSPIDFAAQGFFVGERVLVVEHALLRTPRAPPLLPPDLLGLLLPAAGGAEAQLFDLVRQHLSRDQAVGALGPLPLAFDGDPGRPVNQHHAGRDLVDVLSALAP